MRHARRANRRGAGRLRDSGATPMARTPGSAKPRSDAPRVQERRRRPDRRRRAANRGAEERRSPRDRRFVGPGAALKVAKMRLGRDLEWIWENVRSGNWGEVSRLAGGLGSELVSIAGSIAIIPFGLFGSDLPAHPRLDAPTPSKATGESADRPIVLVHGWFHNRTSFVLMSRRLKKLGRRHVYAVNLPTTRMGVQRLAAILAAKIDHIREVTGASHVDVVGHSLGGLVARWWMHHGGGAKHVKHLVTLGAPHKGTALAAFLPLGSGKAINPGSWTLAELQQPPPRGVKVTVIWSDMDYLILPLEDGGWHDDEGSVRLKYVGHLSLLYSPAVFREVWRALGGGNGS